MGTHRKSDSAKRKAKYTTQFDRTKANKERNIKRMMADNPDYPAKRAISS